MILRGVMSSFSRCSMALQAQRPAMGFPATLFVSPNPLQLAHHSRPLELPAEHVLAVRELLCGAICIMYKMVWRAMVHSTTLHRL
jgi:hypothetical protein